MSPQIKGFAKAGDWRVACQHVLAMPLQEQSVEGKYANFFQVGFNDVEFLLEFGQQFEDGQIVHTRVVLVPGNVAPFLQLVAESWDSFKKNQDADGRETN